MLPRIDIKQGDKKLQSKIADAIAKHCVNVGFFVLVNHGISPSLTSKTREAALRFFRSDDAIKSSVSLERSEVHRGYARIGSEQIDTDGPQDYRETFLAGWEPDGEKELPKRTPLVGPNQWPPDDPEFHKVMRQYYKAAMRVAKYMLECFAISLNQNPKFFSSMFNCPLTNLVLAHYPVLEGASNKPTLGCGEHTDYGLITLLAHDGVAGLQVKDRAGKWLNADSAADELIVNIGDMMQFISGGRYVSNPHRVIAMRKVERTSIPFFVQPDYDAIVRPVVEPLVDKDDRRQWKPRLAGAYLEERFAATFSSPEKRMLKEIKGFDQKQKDTVAKIAEYLNTICEVQ